MRRLFLSVILGVVLFPAGAFADPSWTNQVSLIPQTNNIYTLGTTSKLWKSLYVTQICLSGDCKTAWPGGGSSGFSTTSADYWVLQYDKGFFFSTTSADYWQTQRNFFSTTSADYLQTQRNYFSTSSAAYYTHASTTLVKTYTANTFGPAQTFTAAPVFSSLTGLLKGNGASALSVATNGVDFTLITAKTCPGSDFVSAVTAAGVFTCSTPTGGGGGGAWSWTLGTNFGVSVNSTSTPTHYLNGVFASSTSQFLNFNAYGNVGIGTSSPWGKLSVVSTSAELDTQPAFIVASSSSNYSFPFFMIGATTSVQEYRKWRIAVGTTTMPVMLPGAPSMFYPFVVDGDMYSTRIVATCEAGILNLQTQTADLLRSCDGQFDFDEDGNAATPSGVGDFGENDGTNPLTIWAGATASAAALALAGDGAGLNMSGMGFGSASSTLYFETVIQVSATNASSTLIRAGLGSNRTGSDYAANDATIVGSFLGYTFVATSSPAGNWVAVALDSGGGIGTVTMVDTGVSSSTGLRTKLAIKAYPTSAIATRIEYYINDVTVAVISQNITNGKRTLLNPQVTIGSRVAGLAKPLMVYYVRASKDRPAFNGK